MLVAEGRIVAAGSASSVRVPAPSRSIDLGGETLLPGFINARCARARQEDYRPYRAGEVPPGDFEPGMPMYEFECMSAAGLREAWAASRKGS